MKTCLCKILVTGGDGQLASALKNQPVNKNIELIYCSRKEADITSIESLEQAIAKYQPDVIINTAAYTAVDKAETHPEDALLVNHLGAKNIAIASAKNNIPLIHLSTDYVFDGSVKSIMNESDQTNPLNFYGKSKLLGESAIREHCPKHIILRVSGIFSEYGNNFLKIILRLAQEKKELRVVDDQVTCPTYAGDIANALLTIASDPQHFGTYHFCAMPPVSWHAFAVQIIHAAKRSTAASVTPIRTEAYPTPAKRPAYSVLDCNKIKKDYAISQPDWESAIQRIVPMLVKKGIYT